MIEGLIGGGGDRRSGMQSKVIGGNGNYKRGGVYEGHETGTWICLLGVCCSRREKASTVLGGWFRLEGLGCGRLS